jgi:hypothetical protein
MRAAKAISFDLGRALAARSIAERRAMRLAARAGRGFAEERRADCRCNFCRSHIRFGTSREGQISICDHCGMETLLWEAARVPAFPVERYSIEIHDTHWEQGPFGIRYVTGVVESKAAAELAWVRIQFKLYDHFGIEAGTASDHHRRLRPRDVWSFKALVLNRQAAHAPLSDLTCEYGSIFNPTTATFEPGVAWCLPEGHGERPVRGIKRRLTQVA